jgi:Ser/Thr protein kinase RdoA (MazF antagonist)
MSIQLRMTNEPPYAGLTPDLILNAIDSTGLRTDGRMLALNSYENRVYQTGIEDDKPVVTKFYRPGRWSDEQILEEHAFTAQLAERQNPASLRGFSLRGVSASRWPRARTRRP